MFAEALGISEASVANAERGDTRVGKKVYDAIEDGLGWPEGSTAAYLATGDETLLPGAKAPQPVAAEFSPALQGRLDRIRRALGEAAYIEARDLLREARKDRDDERGVS